LISRKSLFYIFILFLILLPWFNTDIQNDYSISKVSQENVSFYEINPCKISLVQFIGNNIDSIYQNHYYFRPNDKSSIQCFGRIAGVTVMQKELETQFIISVGTNSLINLLFQGLLWVFVFSLVPKNKKPILTSYKYKNLSILLLSYLFAYSIYAESRFYENNLYEFNFNDLRSYLLIFLSYFLISKNLIDIYEERSENLINFIPFVYLFTFIFSGFNFSLLATIFLYLGLVSFFNGEGNSKFNLVFVFLSTWWLINSNGSFYFTVGKLRGFTSSVYEFNANLFWIIFIYILLMGIYKFYIENKKHFNLNFFVKNLSLSSFMILFFGLVSSNIPLFNFFSYYFFGLQRYGVSSNKPFAFDEFGVKISWRGIFPSSETVGEFYGLVLLILLFWIIKRSEIRLIDSVGIFSASLGLYFSDNRTAIVLVFLISLVYVYLLFFKEFINNKFLTLFVLIIFAGSSIYLLSGTSYEFASSSIISQSSVFQYDNIYSSYLRLLNSSQQNGSLFQNVFGLFSTIGFFLNRSEMWGLFFTRYNPTYAELLVGSGPLSFGQLYGEIVINDPESFLLPHSSLLSLIVFIGIVPLIILLVLLAINLIKRKRNYEFLLISIFLFINLIKNDSLNYLVVFLFYSFLFLILRNKGRSLFFR
tara:strand:+ start:1641 stop:3578 length:1938 start_codon:yes stop_codon:yes gene_type:complete